ncbi:MAG TPA: protease pro-enzyme activation domain-containing protein, partial [Polyangiaceae bacterium]|nr:protease pro-enzyme activation domain-containing protein [Polyangiaceae bacterium]
MTQFSEQFGPTPDDYRAVADFARANGLSVTRAADNRLIVPVSGTVGRLETAFHVQLNIHQHPTENRTFYAPDRDPSLALSVPLAHIVGLDNFSIPRPTLVRARTERAIPAIVGSGPGGDSYLGSDLRAAYYGETALTGAGQVVGLFEVGGYDIADVNSTFSTAGQAYSVPINNVLVDGVDPGLNGNDAEQVLDIVAAIGMAPGLSQVRVYIGGATV